MPPCFTMVGAQIKAPCEVPGYPTLVTPLPPIPSALARYMAATKYRRPSCSCLHRKPNSLLAKTYTSTHLQSENCSFRKAKLPFLARVLGYLQVFKRKKPFLFKKKHKYPHKYPTQNSCFVLQKTQFASYKQVLVLVFAHQVAVTVASKLTSCVFLHAHESCCLNQFQLSAWLGQVSQNSPPLLAFLPPCMPKKTHPSSHICVST